MDSYQTKPILTIPKGAFPRLQASVRFPPSVSHALAKAEQALLTLIRNKFAAADGQLDLFPPLAAGGD